MTIKEYKQKYGNDPDSAPGWDSIEDTLKKIYPNQEPKHFAPDIYFSMGGKDPLDGISVYQSNKQTKHNHFITYGLSELYYNEESCGQEFSKYGLELTFRLKDSTYENDINIINRLLQNLARYVYDTGKWFEQYHTLDANGPIGPNTTISALLFIPDQELGSIQTPHGKVEFLQVVGIQRVDYERLRSCKSMEDRSNYVQELRKNNPLLITDLNH